MILLLEAEGMSENVHVQKLDRGFSVVKSWVSNLGLENDHFCYFHVRSAHCSASSLGASETTRRQMQTMWEGGW